MKRVLFSICLAACGTEVPNKTDVSSPEGAARGQLAKYAVDPTSIITDELADKGAVICGRANIKNRSGNYTGWTRFIISKRGDVVAFDETGNPSIREATQGTGGAELFNANYQKHCESTKERSDRLANELVQQEKRQAEEEERQRAEQLATRERKAQEMQRWASGNWVMQGRTEVCGDYSTSLKYKHPDGSLTGSVFGPGDTWTIDADGNVEESSTRWGTTKYTMKKVSANVAAITRNGEGTKRFERCPG